MKKHIDAVTRKVTRPDGSVANKGESLDKCNRVRIIDTSKSSVEEGLLFSTGYEFLLDGGGSFGYIVYKIPQEREV